MRHLAIVEPEVVSQLLNHGLAQLLHSLLPRAADAVDRSAEHGTISSGSNEQLRIGVGVALEFIFGPLVLGRDDNVLHEIGEPRRK
jgi:hypothetical protein